MFNRFQSNSKNSSLYGGFYIQANYSQRNSIRPHSPEKIQSVISSISHRRAKSELDSSTPLPEFPSTMKILRKNQNYLENTLWYREIYIIQDGILEKKDLLNGFKYKFFNFGHVNRKNQSNELIFLFETCSKKWHTKKKFISLFTIEGKLIKSLLEIPSTTKIAAVGHTFEFIGFKALSPYEINEIVDEAFLVKDSEIFITSPRKKGTLYAENPPPILKPNSFLMKFKTKQVLKPVKKKIFVRGDKFKYMSALKMKLGETSSILDRKLPKMTHETLLRLMEKYELTESNIYKLYAQYKTLLMVSVAQNPIHDIRSGISRHSLIEFLRKGDPKEDGLVEKLIETIDHDGKGLLQWEDFLKAMSVIYFGSISQQIDMIFRMYDSDLSGTLSYSEIQELCKQQLKTSKEDKIASYLSESFAKIIFQLAGVSVNSNLSASEIKKVLKDRDQQSIIQMFCNFDL